MPYKDPEIAKQKAAERWVRWSKKFPEKANQRMREWRARNPEYMLVHSAQRRAKRDGIVCELTRETCPPIPEYCPILGIKLEARNDGKAGPISSSPTLDRRDPSKGYTVENTFVISHAANRMKSDMTIEQLERILSYMKGEL